MSDEIVKRILALRPQLTREAVEKLIDEERAKAAGLLTEEAAAHLVASNLGLDGAGERMEAKVRVGDLTSGLGDVSLTGRVIHIFPARRFSRMDGREGKVVRMLLGDSTGTVNVVFWDEKADQIAASKIQPGKLVRVLHGYTRERRGEVEINVGGRGQIYQEPMDAAGEDFPSMDSFFITPGEVQGPGRVNLVGVVTEKLPSSTFTRSDGSEGKVARLALEEGGARVSVVLWDGKVDELGSVEVGTRLRLINGSSRPRQDGRHEVHASLDTVVEVLEVGVKPERPVSPWTKLAELNPGMYSVNVAARIIRIGEVRDFKRNDGSSGKVASILLEDDTGTLALNLWGDEVDHLSRMAVGDALAVESGYTRAGLGGVGLNLGRVGKITINPKDIDVKAMDLKPRITDIQDLREGQSNVTVRGRVLEAPQVREVETARGPAAVASFRIEDDTGEARVSVWRGLVREVEGLFPGTVVKIDNCVVRPPFDGLIQVSSGFFTKIEVERENKLG